jgi:hypothetical protein
MTYAYQQQVYDLRNTARVPCGGNTIWMDGKFYWTKIGLLSHTKRNICIGFDIETDEHIRGQGQGLGSSYPDRVWVWVTVVKLRVRVYMGG